MLPIIGLTRQLAMKIADEDFYYMTTRSRAPERPPDFKFRATNKMTQLGAKLTMGVGNTDTSIKMRQTNLMVSVSPGKWPSN